MVRMRGAIRRAGRMGPAWVAWRSSRCARNGRQHVFLPFPMAFDVIDPPLGEDEVSDDPKYGWCRACRAATRASGYKNCSDVMRVTA